MYIYKTVNLVNGKIYVGKQKTNRKGYLGSGKILKQAFKKYGKENFNKIILEYCNENNIDNRERFWIKKLNSRDHNIGYNICIGGEGGFDHDLHTGKPLSDEHKKNISKNHADVSGKRNPMWGKTHTEESMNKTRQKIKEWHDKGGFTEEQLQKIKINKIGRKNPNYNPTKVIQCGLDGSFVKEWNDLFSLKEDGFNSKLISRVCRGQRKTAFGYKWKFKDERNDK